MMPPRPFFECRLMVGHLVDSLRPLGDVLDDLFSPVTPVLTTIDGRRASGKTILSTAAVLRLVYEVTQFPTSPQEALGLPAGAPLALLVSDNVLAGVEGIVRRAAFFKDRYSVRGTTLRFPGGLDVFREDFQGRGHGQSLGLNPVGLVIDDVDNIDGGVNLTWLGSYISRIRSRRGEPDLIQAVGSLSKGDYEPARPALKVIVSGQAPSPQIKRIRESMTKAHEITLR